MSRAIFVFGVLASATSWAQLPTPGPGGPIISFGTNAPFFEFAPSSGAGMGTACACTTPTGTKGEVMTFTRASSGTCLKGNTASSIANGDLVTCSTNQPRVMPGGAGTGALGMLAEEARTNDLLRSQELENAVWISSTFGVAAITVTANAATAPDGTPTADRLQIPAAGAGQYSLISQSPLTGATRVGSVFAKGNAQSGTLYVMQAGGTVTCSVCAYNPTTWTQCVTSGVSTNQSTFNIGSDPLDCGGGAQGAKDVFVWGAQSEIGAFATSYIATAAASATRAVDVDSLPVSLTNTTGSIAATVVTNHTTLTSGTDYGIVALSTAGPTFKYILDFDNTGPNLFGYFNAATTTLTESLVANSPLRWVAWWDGSSRNLIRNNGGTATGGAPTAVATTLVELGQYSSAHQPSFVIKQVCVDPNPTRCR